MITGKQCAAARALLGWNQSALSEAIAAVGGKLSVTSITQFENSGAIRASNAAKVIEAFAVNGVIIIPSGESSKTGGPGVRLADAQPDAD